MEASGTQGGDIAEAFGAGRIAFGRVRRALFARGFAAREAFLRDAARCTDADALFALFDDRREAVIAATAQAIVTEAAARRVYDIDAEAAAAALRARLEATSAPADPIRRSLDAIDHELADRARAREDARSGRTRVAGGGFGVEGAARGMALAAVAMRRSARRTALATRSRAGPTMPLLADASARCSSSPRPGRCSPTS